MHGFIKFIVRGNMVGLAVGVVFGSLFSSLVQTFVATFITPFISLISGHNGAFATASWHWGSTVVNYGQFFNALITFVLIAAAMYFLIVVPINKIAEAMNPFHDLSKAKRACPECLSNIPARATRCSFCTVAVVPITDETSDQLIEAIPGEIALDGAAPEVELKPGEVTLGGVPHESSSTASAGAA